MSVFTLNFSQIKMNPPSTCLTFTTSDYIAQFYCRFLRIRVVCLSQEEQTEKTLQD